MSDFFKSKTIEELVAEQNVKPFDVDSFEGDLTDEEIDELLEAIHSAR
jgi:hypothetical protein